MSDPVSNVPIEDVLSSIRKLVSEEVRAQVTPYAAQQARAAEPGGAPEKLILSPALRVVEGDAFRDDFGAEDEVIAGFVPDAEPEDEDDSAVILRPFEAMSRSRSRDAATSRDSGQEAGVLWDAEEAGEPPVAASHRMGEDGEAGPEGEDADRRAPISEARDLSQDGVAETAMAVQGRPEDDHAPFDEYMLRELVSEILRQELQGPLGERITRNVRKLVRSEIQRALNARDLY